MDILGYVKFTCWTSIVLLLWGFVMDVIQQSFASWFAFVFFCFISLVIWARSVR